MILCAASPFMNTTIPSLLQSCATPLSTVFSSPFSWKPLSLGFPTVRASPSVEKKATFASRRPGFYRDSNAEDNKFREATTSWWSPSSDDLDSDDEDEEEDDVSEQPWESFGIIKARLKS
ncbi:hypothetical protein AMTRI_Chr12g271770 [Amborella trichopoda]|uniref:Uncharacterized protein n=1 Tax=Amborella trichopoda TaxID=13333 RepID=W1PS78_AMBTC|nr:hypothetical protein AMTR_s00164p00013910 [Amborella trichopoda]